MQNFRVHSLILGADETVQTTLLISGWVKSAGNSIWRCQALAPLGCAVLFTRGAMGSSNKEMALDRCLTHQTLTRGPNCLGFDGDTRGRSAPSGHSAQEKPYCKCGEKHHQWLLCRSLYDLSTRLTNLIGSSSISALGFSGGLPRFTGSLRLRVSGQNSKRLLECAHGTLRSTLNTILIYHCCEPRSLF